MMLRLLFVLYLTTLTTSHTTFSLLPRRPAPQFKADAVMPNESISTISLGQYTAKGMYVVLLFYPFDFTFVCPTEILAFSENVHKFQELNAAVLGVSIDSKFTHLAWRKTKRSEGGLQGVNFPLVADVSKDISRNYGVLVEDSTDPMYGASLRGLFIIDQKGIVRSITINDDHVGRSVDETLRLVAGFQHADKNGVVCPSKWTPGGKTIVPDPEKKKQYFNEM